MAGSGTAHLRPADSVLLRVENLVVEFPVDRKRKPLPAGPIISVIGARPAEPPHAVVMPM